MRTLHVHDVMERKVQFAQDDEEGSVAGLLRRFRRFHHLPVVDSRQRVVGVLTPNDVLEHALLRGHDPVQVRAVMSASPETALEHEPIETVARRMTEHGIRSLPVINASDELVGIVTSTDLLGALAGGAVIAGHADELPVDELMTRDPVTVSPHTSVADAASALVEAGARHLPVVDPDGKLLGILSERDLRAYLQQDVKLWPDASSERLETEVEAIMTPNPTSLLSGTRVGDAFGVFADERFGALPVVDDGEHVVGILSYVDVLRWLRDSAEAEREAAPQPH